MPLKTMKVSELKRHEPALRRSSPTTVHVVRLSMAEFGLLQPPTVNTRTNRVIHLWSVIEEARHSGQESLECWCVDLDDLQESAAALMLNSHLNEFNWEAVASELKKLEAAGFNLHLTGLPESDTGPLLAADWKPAAKVALEDMHADANQGGLL